MRLGWHIGNERPMTGIDWEILRLVPPGVVVLLPGQGVTPEDGKRILEINPICHVILRPYFSPQEVTGPVLQEYIDFCKRHLDDWQVVPHGQRHVQIFNEPNMPRWAQWEGFGDQPEDMGRFEDAFVTAYSQLKRFDPSWRIGLTPLTPGNRDVWFPGDPEGHYYLHGPSGCREDVTNARLAARESLCWGAMELADEHYDHIYIHEGRNACRESWRGLRYRRYNCFRPPGDLWITEAGFPRGDLMPEWAGDALLEWLRILDDTVRGVALWILGDNPMWGRMWYEGDRPSPLVYRLRDEFEEEDVTDNRTARERLSLLPASVKACDARGYDFKQEWFEGDSLFALAHDPQTRRYRCLRLRVGTWEVLEDVIL